MSRKINIILILLWPIIAVLISFAFKISALTSTFIFFGLPALLLSLQKPKLVKNSLIVAAIFIPIMIVVDYIAEHTGAWIIPNSAFNFRLFTYVSVEVLSWAFLHIYFALIFFQYFFEKQYLKKIWDKRSVSALLINFSVFVLFVLTFILYPKFLNIPYWYLIFGTLGILPVVVLEEIEYPRIFQKLIKTAVYFFFLNFTYEIAGINLNWWSFPSKQFIGYVSFFGTTFPFEEFFFWLVLFTLAILSYYEFFFNKEK